MAKFVYVLCALTSVACTLLLWRAYQRTRLRLLFWSAQCFGWLAVNNLLLYVDLVAFPTQVELSLVRVTASVLGVGTLLYGLIWESQ